MVDEVETQPATQTTLSDAELRALAYFAIGIGSEGSIGGRDVSNRLAFAGTIRNGVMDPVGNSGYSIGILQTDLGQHPEAAAQLVDAYQTWARTGHRDWLLTDAQLTQTVNDLGRNGQTIEAQNGRPLDASVKSHLDIFLVSDAGITFVHERDVAQIDTLMRAGGGMDQLRGTALYQGSSLDDQAKLATMILKLENQAGQSYYPRIINAINGGTINSTEEAKAVVNGFMPNRHGPDYIESGMDHALVGTEVFNSLRNAHPLNPLHQPWQAVLADPLVNPTQTGQDGAHPNLSSEYAAIKSLFLQKQSAPALIEALDQGGAYGYNITNSRGQSRPQSTSLYASGDDFVVMDGRGIGKAHIRGVWSDVVRTNLIRIDNRDDTIDLNINRNGAIERLLHIDPNAPVLRPPGGLPPGGEIDPLTFHETAPRVFPATLNDQHQRNGADPALPPYMNQGARQDDGLRSRAIDDPLLSQAEHAVRQLERGLGRDYDHQSACMAASVACLAKANGMSRIDHVVLSVPQGDSGKSENLFVIQGRLSDPTHQRAYMKTQEAIDTPVERSLAQLQAYSDLQQRQPAPPVMDEPRREMGPQMRMG